MKKNELMQGALLAVVGLFAKYESTGQKIDTQEADFKSVAQAVQAAVNAPEDKEPLPEIVSPQLVAAIDEPKLFEFIGDSIVKAMQNMVEQFKAAAAEAEAAAAARQAADSTALEQLQSQSAQ